MIQPKNRFDVLVIGSGAAGLTLALNLPESVRVAVLCKSDARSGSTRWAQGGIAAVLDDQDSVESHVKDTLDAGGGLCHRDAVEYTVSHGRAAIDWLVDLGVGFTRDKNGDTFHLTREGGHSHRRIIHSADATGEAMHKSLMEHAQARSHIQILENFVALDLIKHATTTHKKLQCCGAYAYDIENDRVEAFSAKAVVLATGGASKVYLYTSNPDGASGDGIAMAWRAGCRVANMEFNQFHPTCLYHPNAKSFLVTEALRGEGAHLKLADGTRFMHKFHPMQELAPRDVVVG